MTLDWYSALEIRVQEKADVDQTDPGIWESLKDRIQIAEYQPQKNPLVIEQELNERDKTYFVLKNTREKTYLRLSPVEHQLWQQMDGETTIQNLIVEHFMATGEFAHGTVVRLVEQLYRKSMLTDSPVLVWSQLNQTMNKRSWSYRISLPAQKIMNQPLSFHSLDKPLGLLYRYGGFLFFTRPVQVLLALISLFGLGAFYQIVRDSNNTFLEDNLLASVALLWVASLLPVLIHELGHGLTVKHFGREVPRGGVMLYFGMPAAFVETTDIWLEPKRARLSVTWNGPYTGLILGGAAAILILLFPTSSINSFLFKMAGIAYLTVLFNVNPFLKYDGYYLLSDALDIPSLRERSLAFLKRNFLRKFLNRIKFSREEKIFTVFGLLSLLWTAYAVYLISSVYRSRIQSSLQVVLGNRYSIASRAFSVLIIAGLLSLVFLISLRLIRFFQSLVIQYSRSGGLRHHGQLAIIASGLTILIGIGILLALPGYAPWLGPGLGLLFSFLAAYKLYSITSAYIGSLRGVTYILITSALFFSGLAQLARLIPDTNTITYGSQWLAIILVIAGELLLVWPPKGRLLPLPFLLGSLIGGALYAGLVWIAGLPSIEPAVLALSITTTVTVWGVFSLVGSARSPAFILIGLGAVTICLSWIYQFPYGDLAIVGTLLLAAGAFHLVYARLPHLSKLSLADIPSETNRAIGTSVAILVRRIIAQIFFESGWPGIKRLGLEFSNAMHELGVDINISGNKFQDNELLKRTADELTEIYSLAFDELHRILGHELGRGMGTMSFSYGIDLLPWQTREVLAELVLSRLNWGIGLEQDVEMGKNRRRNMLKRVPLFVTVSDDELDNISNHLKQERFPAGEVIIHEGDEGDKFYILERGKVSVWQTGADEIEHKVDELGPGQYFGEVALVSSAPRNATVRADTPLTLLSLDYREFNQCVRQYVDLADQVDKKVEHSWLLRGMPIFDELTSQELDQLATWLEPETLNAGEILFQEGDPGDKFYIVESGEMVISRQVGDRQVEISRRGPGDYFGEIALLDDRPRTATLTASIDTRLLSLKAEYFQNLLSSYIHLGATVSRTGSRRFAFVQSAAAKTNSP